MWPCYSNTALRFSSLKPQLQPWHEYNTIWVIQQIHAYHVWSTHGHGLQGFDRQWEEFVFIQKETHSRRSNIYRLSQQKLCWFKQQMVHQPTINNVKGSRSIEQDCSRTCLVCCCHKCVGEGTVGEVQKMWGYSEEGTEAVGEMVLRRVMV